MSPLLRLVCAIYDITYMSLLLRLACAFYNITVVDHTVHYKQSPGVPVLGDTAGSKESMS